MKNCIIICEFNPFHFGHEHLIKTVKEMGYNVICLMSGDFTQRGEPAIISKFDRAKIAILGGADLILEYQFPYCSTNSELFTSKAIEISKKIPNIDAIAFGSESNNKSELIEVANNMTSTIFTSSLLKRKVNGIRYSYMIKEVYESLFGKTELLNNSNDILNVGYIKAIIKENLNYEIIPVKRIGSNYNDTDNNFVLSAKQIREIFINGNIEQLKVKLPSYSYEVLNKCFENGEYIDYEKLLNIYVTYYRLFNENKDCNIFEYSDEIINRAKKISNGSNFNEYYSCISNKIFSLSKVKRTLLHQMMNSKKIENDFYLQVLGTNKSGREVLKEIKKTSIDVITKPSDYSQMYSNVLIRYKQNNQLEALYSLLLKNEREASFILKKHPYIKNE